MFDGQCATVTIKTENGPVDINESDYDESIHDLYVEETSVKCPKKNDDIKEVLDKFEVEYPEGAKNADLKEIFNKAVEDGKISA